MGSPKPHTISRSEGKPWRSPQISLSDLKVGDLATNIAGPASTTILSNFGLSAVKVEPPKTGGPNRPFLCDATEPYLRVHSRTRNALTPDMIAEASDALDLVASSELVQAVVLTAAALRRRAHAKLRK
jgi:crotonobetainyl-CoA:carnitine CoA-transferase CaiB-like acyl-CoA transferase